jgi:DNA-binding CsgD family transcriptional regulator
MVKVSSPLTAAEVSLILGISEATVKRLARERQIPCV